MIIIIFRFCCFMLIKNLILIVYYNKSTNFLVDKIKSIVGVVEHIPQLLQHFQKVVEYITQLLHSVARVVEYIPQLF